MPLKALLDDEPFYAWDLSEADRERSFICPLCGDDFVIVLPSLDIVKHFRHKTEREHGTEPETKTHLDMKHTIKNMADALDYDCELEARISTDDLYHIADVLIKPKIVVECQCSKISLKEYEERTEYYHTEGYQIIWILGGALGANHKNAYKPISALETKIYSYFNDVFYYDNGVLYDTKIQIIALNDIISLTDDSFLVGIRREKERIEQEKWHLHHIRMCSQEDWNNKRIALWRENWGANGKYTCPIIPPRRMPHGSE